MITFMVAYIGQQFCQLVKWELETPEYCTHVGKALAVAALTADIFLIYLFIKFINNNPLNKEVKALREQEDQVHINSAIGGMAAVLLVVIALTTLMFRGI